MILHDLQTVELGSPIVRGNLTMFPLLAQWAERFDYLTLDEAIVQQLTEITETSESGSVGQLRIRNDADRPLLILDGEELVGAKQNRIVNLTVLVPPASTLDIPVSCVEAGRWAYRARSFAPAGRTHYAAARAMKLSHVTQTLRADGSRRADQRAIWVDIAEKAVRLDARSETQAAAALYARVAAPLQDLVDAFAPVPSQVGAVFAIRGRVAGMEVFDSPQSWCKQAPKVIRSYGLDAFDSQTRSNVGNGPQQFLQIVRSLTVLESPALGLGTDVRFEGHGIAGAALVVDGAPIHTVAFAMGS